MITFYKELLERLKTGSIKNVLLFGNSTGKLPQPYAVVKPIASGDQKVLQVIAHTALGMHQFLEAYIFRELPELLKKPLESGGKYLRVMDRRSWYGPYVDEGDDTLAMSRDFYVPVVL